MSKGAAEASKAQEQMQKDAEASAAAFKKEQEAAAAAFDAMQDKAVATGKITAAEADKRSKEFQKQQTSDSATFSKLQKEQMALVDKKAKEESKAGKEREQLAKKATDGLSKMRNEILGIATALLGVAGIKSFGEHLINSSAELGRTSDLLGINAEKLTAWQAAAEKTGTSIESVRGAFAAFNKLKQQLQTGDSAGIESINSYARAMAGVGKGSAVASGILADRNVSSEEKLLEIAKETEGLSVKDRAMVLSKLNLSEDMALVLAQGRDALAASVDHFASLHPDIEKAQEESRGLKAAWVEFKETIGGASETLLVSLKPVLDQCMQVMRNIGVWVAAHPKMFEGVFFGLIAITASLTAISAMSFFNLIGNIGKIVSALGSATTAVEGATLAVEGAGGLAGAFSSLSAVGGPILGMLAALGLVTAAMAKLLDMWSHRPNLEKGGRATVGGYNLPNDDEHAGKKFVRAGRGGTWVDDPDYKKPVAKTVEDHIGMIPGRRGQGWIKDPNYKGWNSAPSAVGSGAAADIAQLESLGWTHAQASGIVANLQRESSGNEKAVGDNGKAYGLGQWHPDRQANFAKFAGKDIHESSHAEQIAFVNYELRKGSEQNAGRQLGGATSAADAAAIISRSYERPKDKENEAQARSSIAESLAKLSSGAADAAAIISRSYERPKDKENEAQARSSIAESLAKLSSGAAVDRSLAVGSQAAVANTQSSSINNQASNTQSVENHIGAVHINAPNAKTNADVASAMGDKLQSYSFASMANMGLA